jgi:plasmid stabilization system protein ParE
LDLQVIHEYIAKDSPGYANRTIEKIVGTVETIPAFPFLGRAVPEIGLPAIRERIVGNYRIMYRIAESAIQILTVHHSARSLENS